MCGIAGIINKPFDCVNPESLEKMTQSVVHRGPDAYGYTLISSPSGNSTSHHNRPLTRDNTLSNEFNIGLGHRRLSIIDLTDKANQPMQSKTNESWITYNGEIYNYIELREELIQKDHVFSSASDTEVILHAYAQWGFDCLDKLNGMFAFAIWDQKKQILFCARDRFGMKPFYYFFNKSSFLFGSEIKQLLTTNSIDKEINNPLAYDFLAHSLTDHSHQTLFKKIYQIEPGNFLLLHVQQNQLRLDKLRYWSIPFAQGNYAESSDKYLQENFLDLLTSSIKQHLRSDVSVGSCLSGGLDSSSIVCLIKVLLGEKSTNQQLTFSSCFENKAFDERIYSDLIAKTTDAKNYKFFPDLNSALDNAIKMLDFHDEPFGSTSQFAQWFLFKNIQASGIKVVLDGQGADELLAGYHNTYGAYFHELLKGFQIRALLHEIKSCKNLHGYGVFPLAKFFVSAVAINKLGIRLGYKRGSPSWLNRDIFQEAKNNPGSKWENVSKDPLPNFLSILIQFNLNALLRYEDRSSMAHSVEARLPFLDHRLVEFLFSLPSNFKIRNGWTKYILRQSMTDIVPDKVRLRKDKMGFVTPEKEWLTRIPSSTIDDILFSKSVKESGIIDMHKARRKIQAVQSGKEPFNFLPWRILNFCLWIDRIKSSA